MTTPDNTPAPDEETYTVRIDGDQLLDAFSQLTTSVQGLIETMAEFSVRLEAVEQRTTKKKGRGFTP